MQHGLGEVFHVGKKFTEYEEKGDKVVAFFEDGVQVEGDLLIGISLSLPSSYFLLILIIFMSTNSK